MRGILSKLYEQGRLLERPQLISDEADVYNHQLYNTVYAVDPNSQTLVLQDAQIYLIEPQAIRIHGIEKVNGVFYKQDWYLQL